MDLHTHLREPGREDAETVLTGSKAAALGGFTAVLAMANTSPVTDTAEAAERILDLGRLAGLVDVQPVGAVTHGLGGQELAELGLMARSRAKVRVFSDDGKCVHDPRVMRRALEYIRAFGGVISQHSQDPDLAGPTACCHEGELSGRLGLPGWPGIAEETIVARDVMLARHTNSRVHVAHVSTAGSVEVIRWAKAQGINVTAEVTPHHLLLTTDLLAGYDPVYKVNPPLRPDEDVAALRDALADGTIDAVATDHAPHARHDKEHAFVDAAFGMLGLETALSVVSEVMVTSGAMTWADVAPGDVAEPRADRRSRGTRRHAGRGPAGQHHPGRPGRRGRRGPCHLRVALAQQPLARPQAHRRRGGDRAARSPDRLWTGDWSEWGCSAGREPTFPELAPVPAMADLPKAKLQSAARYLGTLTEDGEKVVGKSLSAQSSSRLNLSPEALDVVRMAGSFRIPAAALRGATTAASSPASRSRRCWWSGGSTASSSGAPASGWMRPRSSRAEAAGRCDVDQWVRTISKMARTAGGDRMTRRSSCSRTGGCSAASPTGRPARPSARRCSPPG